MTQDASPAAPRRQPVHPDIDEAMIGALVEAFYARVAEHPRLGVLFADGLTRSWAAHRARMVTFWSSVMLRTGAYHGRPMQAHRHLDGLQAADFALWLELFSATAREVLPAAIAALFIERAERIADSLRLGLTWDPAAAAPGARREAAPG